MLTIYYMEKVKDQDHAAAVNQILIDFFNYDQGSEEEDLAAFQKLQVIKDLGEDEIFEELLEDLKEDDRFAKFITE